MRISNISVGSKIKCCGNTAIILKHGIMGVRVNVLNSEFDSTILGFQLWSNNTTVKLMHRINTGFDNSTKFGVSTQSTVEVPLNLF